MIQIKPKIESEFKCPLCRKKIDVEDVIFSGMRTLAFGKCFKCGNEFYSDFPIGPGTISSFQYCINTNKIYPAELRNWYSKYLGKTIDSKNEDKNFEFKKIKEKKGKKRLIIINCLDVCYGHSLQRLLNVQKSLDYNKKCDVLVIVPSFLTWMVPKEVSNIIEVKIPLKEGYQWLNGFDEFIKKEIKNYNEVFLSKDYLHPHPNNYDIERFVGIKPFNIKKLEKVTEKPTITFVWREDRLINSENFLFRVLNKITKITKIRVFKKISIHFQKKKVIKLYKFFSKKFNKVDFALIGTDNSLSFPSYIKDLRNTKPDKKVEKQWCNRYSKSHLIIGVHGSNMLLPSALGGMTLELLPDSRLSNYLEDILFSSANDIRINHFRYRLIPLNSSFKTIKNTALSMITRFPSYNKKMTQSKN